MSQRLPIRVRPASVDDVPFICSSWLKSYRGADAVKDVPSRTYYYYQHRVLEELLPRSVTLVACLEDDPNTIVGYLTYEVVDTALVVHWLYLKHTFRRMGIAKELLKLAADAEKPPAIFYTHYTRACLWAPKEFSYNPYLVWVRLPAGWEQRSE